MVKQAGLIEPKTYVVPPQEILALVSLLDLDLRWHELTGRWRFYYYNNYYYSVDNNMSAEDWRVHISAVLDARRSK